MTIIEQSNDKQSATKYNKNFEDLIITIAKGRKFLFWNTLIITLVAIGVSLLLPNWYTAKTSVLLPKKEGGIFGDISSFSTSLKDISKTLGKLGTTSDEAFQYIAILQSRTSKEAIIERFNLREVYEIKPTAPIEDVLNYFEDKVKINVEEEGYITIAVTDKDPMRAKNIADYYVEVLNKISIDLGITEARNNRLFIEQRYNSIEKDISMIEDSLKRFSHKYDVYSLDEQTKAAITMAAEINGMIIAKEIELDIKQKRMDLNNPEIVQLIQNIQEMKKKLNQMKYKKFETESNILKLFVPFENLPEIGIEYIRLKREFELQTKLLEFILPIYEQAKIEEKKNTPVVLVLDQAKVPQKKSRPMRSLIVITMFIVSLILGVCYVLIRESYNNLKLQPNRYNNIYIHIILPLKNLTKYFKKK